VDFETGWQAFSARRSPGDYPAWRDQRDWTVRKYAMLERGHIMGANSGMMKMIISTKTLPARRAFR
jgi:hypothetical protein